jgi:hypothetical protein
MITIPKFHNLSPASIILIMLLSGCYHTPESIQQPEVGVQQATVPPVALNDPPTVAPAEQAADIPAAVQAPTPPAAEVTENDKVSLASAEPSSKPEPVEPVIKVAPTKPKIDIRDPYNQSKPTLIGLTLNTTIEKVVLSYGKPKEQFVMDEEHDPITVYDYTDFLIGFNRQNLLKFIDIRSADINPGLNGLKLGQSTSSVYEALGKPDSNTAFVFQYNSTGAILKLDIDPQTDKVNSIKLFTLD